jgi:hypothetical protein
MDGRSICRSILSLFRIKARLQSKADNNGPDGCDHKAYTCNFADDRVPKDCGNTKDERNHKQSCAKEIRGSQL